MVPPRIFCRVCQLTALVLCTQQYSHIYCYCTPPSSPNTQDMNSSRLIGLTAFVLLIARQSDAAPAAAARGLSFTPPCVISSASTRPAYSVASPQLGQAQLPAPPSSRWASSSVSSASSSKRWCVSSSGSVVECATKPRACCVSHQDTI